MSGRLIALAGVVGWRSLLLLSAATVPLALASPASAQSSAQFSVESSVESSAGVVSGVVRSGHDRSPVAGAQVRVLETGSVAVTDAQGRYRFGALPRGPKTLQVGYVGFAVVTTPITVGVRPVTADITLNDARLDGPAGTVTEVVVTGRRAGQARALNAQRSADNTRNVVSADQAGRFPDLNAAESLRRLPGVTVQREVVGGDGRYVSIRGLDSGLNNTQVNGMNAAQPEKENRRVPLDMIQTSALASITVHKTLTPEQDADGIGGAVELETATAFDFAGPVIDLTVRGFQQELRGKTGLIGELTLARRFGDQDQFGVLLSVARAERQTQGYVFYNDEDQLAFIEDEPSSGVTPIQYHQTEYQNERETLSANLALSWRVSDNTDLDFKASYNRLYDEEQSRAFYLQAGTDEYDDDGALILTEPGTANIFNQYEETELTQQAYVLRGQTRAGALTFDYSLGFSEAIREEPFDNEVAFQAELESNLLGYTQQDGFPIPNLTANDRITIADPDSYSLGYNDIDIDNSRNRRTAGTFDVTYDLAGSWLSRLKAGVKFERSEKTLFEANVLELTGPLTLNEFGVGDLIDVSKSGAPYPAFLSLNQDRVRNWRQYGLNLAATNPDFTNEYEEDDGIPLDEDSYTSREDIFGAYVMGQVERDAWDLTGGLRLDYTRVESDNYELIELEDEDPIYGQTTGEGDYLSVLPRVQFNYRPTADRVFRAAYYTSIARPEPLYMAGAVEIEEDDGEVDVTVGNPGLEPAYAHNLDFSFERYFDTVGLISVGAYAKYIDKFIFSGVAPETEADRTRFENDPRLAGRTIDDVITYTNGEDATIYGLELNLVRNFPDLPGAWGGLGVYANLTVQRSEADAGLEGAGEGDFFYAPELFYTAGLTYQKYGIEGALAYSWRDEQAVRFSTYNTRIMEEAYGSLDVQLSYRMNPRVKLSLDAVDVLNDGSDPVVDERFGSTGLLEGATYVGRSITAGINVRF
jgi:TonB-dependent receptor